MQRCKALSKYKQAVYDKNYNNMNIYENNLEHLLEELRRIDLIINLSLKKWGRKNYIDIQYPSIFTDGYLKSHVLEKILEI